jgi:hypothetical protein
LSVSLCAFSCAAQLNHRWIIIADYKGFEMGEVLLKYFVNSDDSISLK